MTTMHDDRPHPVPPHAFLRYKENYFFIIMDPERGVFGISHLNNEPLFDRSRFTLNLNIRGRQFTHSSETPIPTDFEMAEQLSDGTLTVRFTEAHKRFDMSYRGDEVDLDIAFLARYHTFDFAYCKTAAPENPSFQEVMTLGTNLPYNHHQQALTTQGRIVLKKSGETIEVNGLGYRDHSWAVRTDAAVRRHYWNGLNFPSLAIGMKTLETLVRPGVWAKEGYVSDKSGDRALRSIAVEEFGQKDGWPEKLRYRLVDVYGKPFTIDIDIAGRYSDVPLHSEKSQPGKPSYRIIETCSPLVLLETGEKGVGLVEIGQSSALEE
jgi:hypothetical protein